MEKRERGRVVGALFTRLEATIILRAYTRTRQRPEGDRYNALMRAKGVGYSARLCNRDKAELVHST